MVGRWWYKRGEMNNEYTIKPFSELKVGQEFYQIDDIDLFFAPWVKTGENSYNVEGGRIHHDAAEYFPKGCLVRIADCELELGTENLEEALSIISNRCDLDQYECDLLELVRMAKLELEALK